MSEKKNIKEIDKDIKKDIVACLKCRINHRKCDGNRPCYHCIKRKIGCENDIKRKAVGRPKMTELEKKEKKLRKASINCEICKTSNKNTYKFCSNCGQKLPSLNNYRDDDDLKQEIEILKQKVNELNCIIDMGNISVSNQSQNSDMYFLKKIIFPKEENFLSYPLPSFLMESSKAFIDMLGYTETELYNAYMPNLIPKKQYHTTSDKDIMFVKLKKDHSICKFNYEENLFIKNRNGKYVHLILDTSVFLDNKTKIPEFASCSVTKVCQIYEESKVPSYISPTSFTFYGDSIEDLPPSIKKRIQVYSPNKTSDNFFSNFTKTKPVKEPKPSKFSFRNSFSSSPPKNSLSSSPPKLSNSPPKSSGNTPNTPYNFSSISNSGNGNDNVPRSHDYSSVFKFFPMSDLSLGYESSDLHLNTFF